jgi:hypothetical protein
VLTATSVVGRHWITSGEMLNGLSTFCGGYTVVSLRGDIAVHSVRVTPLDGAGAMQSLLFESLLALAGGAGAYAS